MRRRVFSFLAFTLACGSASCAAILGFERLQLEDAADGGGEGGTLDVAIADRTSDGPNPACGELGIPDPPHDAAPGSVPSVLGALRLLDFGIDLDGGRPQIPGYNLDLTCSNDVVTSSCTTTLIPTAFETHAKDKNANGLDNAGFSLIEYISRFSDLLSAAVINDGIAAGKYGAVLRVDGWNGQPDDDSVQIEIFPTIGFIENGDGGTTPNFDENDVWGLDDRFKVPALEASSTKSNRAWVVGGKLVGLFAEATLPIIIDNDPKPFDIHMRDVVMSATLANDAAGKPILKNGSVAGRWRTSEFLSQVRTIYVEDANGLTDTVLCDKVGLATVIYSTVKDEVCKARDIRSDSQDNKNFPCDAVSAGMAIETYSVKQLGTFITPFDGGVRCADPAVPEGDDCAP